MLCLNAIKETCEGEKLQIHDIFKLTIWLTEIEDFQGFNLAFSDFFGTHKPTRSTVRADLMVPDAKIEIEAIVAY